MLDACCSSFPAVCLTLIHCTELSFVIIASSIHGIYFFTASFLYNCSLHCAYVLFTTPCICALSLHPIYVNKASISALILLSFFLSICFLHPVLILTNIAFRFNVFCMLRLGLPYPASLVSSIPSLCKLHPASISQYCN